MNDETALGGELKDFAMMVLKSMKMGERGNLK